MNNKLIALAVAGALTAPMMAVEAAPKVYGIMQVEYQQTDSSTANSDITEAQDNKFGRFGFKGSEDLGGGLKAVYTMEFGIDSTSGNLETDSDTNGNGANGIFKRESSIGLKIGKAHEVRMGNIKSPYKYFGGVKYDGFVATSLQAREGSENTTGSIGGGMSGGAYGQGGFLTNSISYMGKFKPVTVWAASSLGEEDESISSATSGADNPAKGKGRANGHVGGVFILGVKAKVGAFEFGAASASKDSCDNGAANADCANEVAKVESTKLFGSWTGGQHTVRVQVENREVTREAAALTTAQKVGVETDYSYVNYRFKMGKHLVDLAVGEKDDGTAATNKDVSWSRLAYAYNFSKKTRVFAGVSSRDTDGTGVDTDVTTIGMTMKF